MTAPVRRVDTADLFDWLSDPARPHVPGAAVVAVLPDAEEVGLDMDTWRDWFHAAASACIAATDGPAMFLQTDRMKDRRWVDKAGMIATAAAWNYRDLVWHKVVTRRDVGAVDLHRPTYSHLLAYEDLHGRCGPGQRTPDVIEGGRPLWRNGIGVDAARFIIDYLAGQGVTTILNPGCGVGTILAAANEYGLDAYGCDVDPDRVTLAEGAAIDPR